MSDNVVTLNMKPCKKCHWVYTLHKAVLGEILGCNRPGGGFQAAVEERKYLRGCGPQGDYWKRKEK